LGLSQTDLLRLEKALATPQPATSQPSPSVIWLSAQACSGCPVSLLNRVNSIGNGGTYYDADMLNAAYGGGFTGPLTPPPLLGGDPKGTPLAVVNDAADLLVGDAVRTVVNLGTPGAIVRSNVWADDYTALAATLPGSLLAAYAGAFPTGYITLDWNATVMAAAGDIPAGHLKNIRNGGGILGVFVLVVDGSIPAGDDRFCYVFDNDIQGGTGKVIDSLPHGEAISANIALEWLASAPGCIGVVSQGTCAAYGGIPGGVGNRTGAIGVADYLASKSIGTPVINVPGCPPHPDWTVYTVAYILAVSTPSSIQFPAVDQFGRPSAVYSGSTGDSFTPFCYDCPNKDTQGLDPGPGYDTRAQYLGDAGCVGGLGCKGPYTVGDCPIRGKNTTDDGLSMNWCIGASGQNSAGPGGSGVLVTHVGEARHPCQGCIMPDFPDYSGLTGTGERTTGRVKGFYNE
jgi:Ni,Fe-hydrogenase I small subunit